MGTHARVSDQVPHVTMQNLPILPPDPPATNGSAPEPESSEDNTLVDPKFPIFAAKTEHLVTESTETDFVRDHVQEIEERASTTPPPVLRPKASAAKPPPIPYRAETKSSVNRARPRASRAPQVSKFALPAPPTERASPKPQPPSIGKPTGQPRGRAKAGKDRTLLTNAGEPATAVVADPMAPLEGPLVGGRYRIVERVGQGGMGKVYKVTHAQLGKTFALKIISEKFQDEGKARDLFFREARLASSLSHPNIASVVDFGEDEQYGAFMVMEFLEGEPLSRILRRETRLSVRQACDIMVQVAEALHYIHSNKIVHCDIKTENILQCQVPGSKRKKQLVKLLDFGLARSTAAGRNTSSLSGTPHYVAPERIRGERASPQSDIYGLGILFYELLTGKVPWDGNVAQILCGHLDLAPTPPSKLIEGGLDQAVENLILRALAKSTRNRHKNMAAFIYELRTVMDMLGFGRRKRGNAKRVVIERQENKRDELARTVFDSSRIPMALINRSGQVVVANAAFARFVMGVTVDVEGLDIGATPLANAWETFEKDLARASHGESVRRILEVDVGESQVRRLLMWLDPGPTEDNALFGVHPLDS